MPSFGNLRPSNEVFTHGSPWKIPQLKSDLLALEFILGGLDFQKPATAFLFCGGRKKNLKNQA